MYASTPYVALLHCTQVYPAQAPYAKDNLRLHSSSVYTLVSFGAAFCRLSSLIPTTAMFSRGEYEDASQTVLDHVLNLLSGFGLVYPPFMK